MVYVVNEGLARRRFVQIGQDDGKMTEIASGLETSDVVVDRPARDLADKTPVEIDE